MTNNSILITGGSGFIGSNLVRAQKLLGRSVTVFDLVEFSDSATPEDRPDRVIIGDVTDPIAISEAVRGHDAIVHLAAQTGVPSSIENPDIDCITNVVGTMRVLDAARLEGVGNVVVASSAAPLGRAKPPASEDTVPLPISPYGASKLACEAYCMAYHGSYGLNAVALRFANVYGPGAGHKESVVAKFMKDILNQNEIRIDGDGGQTRDFIHVEDLCSAIDDAVVADIGGEVFQIGTGTETSITQLANLIVDVSNLNVDINFAPSRQGDVARNYSDITKAKSILKWVPKVQLEMGILETWRWFKDNYKGN